MTVSTSPGPTVASTAISGEPASAIRMSDSTRPVELVMRSFASLSQAASARRLRNSKPGTSEAIAKPTNGAKACSRA